MAKMRRGQAFETMMLVIGVIVALAILAALMGILGMLNPSIGDARTQMKDMMKQLYSEGYGVKTPSQKVTFKPASISSRQILTDLAISDDAKDKLTFKCIGIMAENSVVEGCDSSSIQIMKEIDGTFAVCADPSKDTFAIVLGGKNDAAKASSECEDAIK